MLLIRVADVFMGDTIEGSIEFLSSAVWGYLQDVPVVGVL